MNTTVGSYRPSDAETSLGHAIAVATSQLAYLGLRAERLCLPQMSNLYAGATEVMGLKVERWQAVRAAVIAAPKPGITPHEVAILL